MQANATSEGLPSTLERLSDRAVPGSERLTIGTWRLRAGFGVTGRANSTWAPGAPPVSVADAVDDVEAWYRNRRLTPRFQVFDHVEPELVAELDRRRWPTTVDSLVMVAPAAIVIDRARPPAGEAATVEVSMEPTPRFCGLLGDDRRLREVTETGLPQRFVTVVESGDLLGGGMATVDGRWAAVGAMNTRPEVRRRGVASVVLATLGRAVGDLGVETMWLQVQSDNDGAVALYRGLGFETVHRYRYRNAPER